MEPGSLAATLRRIEERHVDLTGLPEGKRRVDVIRAQLALVRTRERDIALSYTIPDPWEMALFIALCRRFGLDPFRQPRRHQTSVSVLGPESFGRITLWPMFADMADALRSHMRTVLDEALRHAFEGAEAAENANGPGAGSG